MPLPMTPTQLTALTRVCAWLSKRSPTRILIVRARWGNGACWPGSLCQSDNGLRHEDAHAHQRSPPHLIRQLHDHTQLCPLLLLAEHVAFLGRSKTALRREAELLDRHKTRGVFDAALDDVFLLHAAGLG